MLDALEQALRSDLPANKSQHEQLTARLRLSRPWQQRVQPLISVSTEVWYFTVSFTPPSARHRSERLV